MNSTNNNMMTVEEFFAAPETEVVNKSKVAQKEESLEEYVIEENIRLTRMIGTLIKDNLEADKNLAAKDQLIEDLKKQVLELEIKQKVDTEIIDEHCLRKFELEYQLERSTKKSNALKKQLFVHQRKLHLAQKNIAIYQTVIAGPRKLISK